MPETRKFFSWVLLHLAVIVLIIISLLTGLRIATLTHPELLFFDVLLPQGYLHGLHLYAATGLLSVALAYIVYLVLIAKGTESGASSFHRMVIHIGRLVILSSITTGVLLYSGVIASARLLEVHYWSALLMIVYLFLHVGVYFIQYGIKVFSRILFPAPFALKKEWMIIASVFLVAVTLIYISQNRAYHLLPVKQISATSFIEVDGVADEAMWDGAETIVINTFAGANLEDGESRVTIKALQNSYDVFFHFSWEDQSESRQHLPLIKTEQGWKIQESDFYQFDENQYYEDKFAVMVSANCEPGASKTAYLGSKPLADKPANWHGKGYHYSDDGEIRDLWHWKAVRTDDMRLADDNFIGKPDVRREGLRRYSAGIFADGKESGGYVMNWKWYAPDGVTPKLLPKDSFVLDAYQKKNNSKELSWVIPWYDYDLYSPEKDTYPIGTVMPSVIYTSNRFEGDRADVQAKAQWHEGRWSLEIARSIDTGSNYDVTLQEGVCLWVSVFDHAQIAHTRHVLPVRLTFGESND